MKFAALLLVLASTSAYAAPSVVQTGTLTSSWGNSAWSPSAVTLKDVKAGNALIFLFAAWVSSLDDQPPTDSNGTWLKGVDDNLQLTREYPPVFTQIYYQLNVAGGTHVIVPQPVGRDGDGRVFVLEVSGLEAPTSSGKIHKTGTNMTGISVSPTTGTAKAGDFLVAIGVEDDTQATEDAKFSLANPSESWISAGSQQRATDNVGCDTRYGIVGNTPPTISWVWPGDPNVNVADAAVMTFKPSGN